MTDLNLLADCSEIIELFARYAHTIDSYDRDGWANCFTDDGIFEVQAGEGGIRFVGRKALQDFAEANIRLVPGTRHAMTNHVIDIKGTRASHECTLTGMLSRPEKVYTFVSGWYESSVTKVDDQWKINHRIAHVDNHENFKAGEFAVHMQPMMGRIAENGTAA